VVRESQQKINYNLCVSMPTESVTFCLWLALCGLFWARTSQMPLPDVTNHPREQLPKALPDTLAPLFMVNKVLPIYRHESDAMSTCDLVRNVTNREIVLEMPATSISTWA